MPAPTDARVAELASAARNRSGTLAEQRAAAEREALEPAMKQKRKVSQLQKMQRNSAFQTGAGKRAIGQASEPACAAAGSRPAPASAIACAIIPT